MFSLVAAGVARHTGALASRQGAAPMYVRAARWPPADGKLFAATAPLLIARIALGVVSAGLLWRVGILLMAWFLLTAREQSG